MISFGGNICAKAFGLDSSFGALRFNISLIPPKKCLCGISKKVMPQNFFEVPTEVITNVYCIELILLKY